MMFVLDVFWDVVFGMFWGVMFLWVLGFFGGLPCWFVGDVWTLWDEGMIWMTCGGAFQLRTQGQQTQDDHRGACAILAGGVGKVEKSDVFFRLFGRGSICLFANRVLKVPLLTRRHV